VVVVHDLELALEANDSTSSSGSQLLAETVHKLLRVGGRLDRLGATNLKPKDLRAEFSVRDRATLVGIVKLEQNCQVLSGGDLDSDLLNSFSELIGA